MTVLVVLAVASIVCWALVLVAVLLHTQPAEIEPGPRTLDHGDEPPALVNLLVNGWRPTREALVATLIDLAARRIISFQQVGPAQTLIRVPRSTHPGLRPYEQNVLSQVAGLAHKGVVPAAALVRGEANDDNWPSFRKQVIADARARGLSRRRFSTQTLLLLNLASLFPGVMAGLLTLRLPGEGPDDVPWTVALFVCLFVWGNLFGFAGKRQAERDTATGRAAASRWLGYREHLAENEQFNVQPPGAVEIWDRHLAYAATFGVAEAASEALPIGGRDDRSAWSSFGGTWHRVRISYPTSWRWGTSPLRTGFHGVWRSAAGFFGVRYLARWQDEGREIDPNDLIPVFDPITPGQFDWVYDVGIAVFTLLLLLGATNLVLAIAERISRRERVGEVLRVKSGNGFRQAAITDGHSAKTRAYRIFANNSNVPTHLLREHSRVRFSAGRFLGYVARLEPLPEDEVTAVLARPPQLPKTPP